MTPSPPDAPRVSLSVHNAVATLTMHDEKRRNAMTVALGDAVQEAVGTLASMSSVRAAVLAGAGDAFSAGGDLAMLEHLRSVGPDEAYRHMRAFYARYLSVRDVVVPTIAAVRGPAIGAGLCVAIACDLMIVDEDAKLAFNFVALGLHPGMGATALLPARVGAQRAAELLFTGRRFDGREAVRMGLALEAVPADRVVPRALELAESIAAQGPSAVVDLKRNLALDRRVLDEALDREARAQARSYGSDDLGEGLRAAHERRAPRFSGA